MSMLQRITAILERARLVGGWIDEDVAAAVLAEMRNEPTRAMVKAGSIVAGEDLALAVWRDMIDAAP